MDLALGAAERGGENEWISDAIAVRRPLGVFAAERRLHLRAAMFCSWHAMFVAVGVAGAVTVLGCSSDDGSDSGVDPGSSGGSANSAGAGASGGAGGGAGEAAGAGGAVSSGGSAGAGGSSGGGAGSAGSAGSANGGSAGSVSTAGCASESPSWVFCDDFESGTPASPQNGVAWKATGANVTVSTDQAHSGTYALRFRYPGKADECADATAEQRFSLPDLAEVWLEYRLYLPSNFAHRKPTTCTSNAANQKLLRVWGPSEGDYGKNNPKGGASFDPIGTGPDSFVYLQWGDYNTTMLSTQDPASRWNNAFTDARRGTWIDLRWHLKLASADGAGDGQMRLWVDGVLMVTLLDKDWHTQAGVGNWFSSGYLMGWANSSYEHTTDFFVDDFRVYDSDPGWT